MILGGLITLVIGLGMTLLLRDAPIGPVAFIVTAVGLGITLRGLFVLAAYAIRENRRQSGDV